MDELFPVVVGIIEKIENENVHFNNYFYFSTVLVEIQELKIIYQDIF